MSQVLINQYLAELDRLKKIGGTHRESVVREAFKDLHSGWGRQHDLTFIPDTGSNYRLGNRSTIDWVLDQHNEKKPKVPTISEKFHTCRFAEHKERVVELLARVVRVSVVTRPSSRP